MCVNECPVSEVLFVWCSNRGNFVLSIVIASETLTGVTQSKIGDVYLLASERSELDTISGNSIEISLYLLASERSERDTYSGNTIENRGCLFIGERA